MTEIETIQSAPEADETQSVETHRAPARRGRGSGGSRSTIAIVLSVLALAVSCTALALQLRSTARSDTPAPEIVEEAPEPEPEIPTIHYRNHILPILEDVPVNSYDPALFQTDENGYIRYQDAPLGIDVSSYQGDIDWEQVAASGVEFAMIRMGLRGYTKGGIMEDAKFEQNIRGATAAGLDVGIYFFSQAIDEQEAEKEAVYVLEHIADYSVTYPVVFDWESVADDSARTNGTSSDTVTRCASAFCDRIAAAGYTPMIYFNMDQAYLAYQLDKLSGNAFWLAEYHDSPRFYYGFEFWQYTHMGSVPGIDGAVDLDLDLRGYAKGAEDGGANSSTVR